MPGRAVGRGAEARHGREAHCLGQEATRRAPERAVDQQAAERPVHDPPIPRDRQQQEPRPERGLSDSRIIVALQGRAKTASSRSAKSARPAGAISAETGIPRRSIPSTSASAIPATRTRATPGSVRSSRRVRSRMRAIPRGSMSARRGSAAPRRSPCQ